MCVVFKEDAAPDEVEAAEEDPETKNMPSESKPCAASSPALQQLGPNNTQPSAPKPHEMPISLDQAATAIGVFEQIKTDMSTLVNTHVGSGDGRASCDGTSVKKKYLLQQIAKAKKITPQGAGPSASYAHRFLDQVLALCKMEWPLPQSTKGSNPLC